MRFISILLVLFMSITPLFGFQQPTSVKINYPAISVRETHQPTSKKSGIVYANREYQVLDVIFSYYKIELPNQTYGWVYGHPQKNIIEFNSQNMTLKSSTTVSVRSEKNSKSERIAITSPNIKYKVIDYYISHIKVKSENDIVGWIYTGNYQNSWTSLSNSLNKKNKASITIDNFHSKTQPIKTEIKSETAPKIKNKTSSDKIACKKQKKQCKSTTSPKMKITNPQSGLIKWSKAKGDWQIKNNQLQIDASKSSRQCLFIESEKQYSKANMDIVFTYQKSDDADISKWNHARGFGVVYIKNNETQIEFRYLPDVKQLSMYIVEGATESEFVEKNVELKENEPIIFSVSINSGLISWKVNGQQYFKLINTSIKNGAIRLINFNNNLKINIDKFQLCYNYVI
jgi:hypothetical protein